jgi:hypothetical protein
VSTEEQGLDVLAAVADGRFERLPRRVEVVGPAGVIGSLADLPVPAQRGGVGRFDLADVHDAQD